ncbi:short chain dehydrogenase reductase family [Moniliophthora roreri MCA 2997]|uniref:Short chain dehydrogenase reductase family n=2 Tax=Moniliophthora roreri TaxID=221103 RepID=V2XPM1_MONRO|nr:short chain dehydrogenase reductase family [Moniliophthora roreri MCA 2997]KAI3621180.1 short chain dehydrogenase reductase family [Moniliophthora roreri]
MDPSSSPDPRQVPQNENRFDPARLFAVEGLVAVITGGGTGIGLVMARALEHNGATVYIVGRRLEKLQEAARENSRFNKIIPLQGDVTSRESLLRMVEVIKSRHGYIDLLVNNAGIIKNLYPHPLPSPTSGNHLSRSPPSPPPSPSHAPTLPSIRSFQAALWDSGPHEDFAETFATNVTAVYYATVAFLDLLHQGNIRKQVDESSPLDPIPRLPLHTSQVISISSSGAFRLDSNILSMSYTLSKAACTHLGKTMANLLSPWGIRSNVLAPGVWPSEMSSQQLGNIKLDPLALATTVPLKRAGTEEEMAGTILFLASRAGAYINGAVWLVDGGRVGMVASSH